jgi:hypothetical protein
MIPRKMPILDLQEYTFTRFCVSAACGSALLANKAKTEQAGFEKADIA